MKPILKIDKLRKTYGKIVALNNLNMEVKEGEVFGLLGPNGSGKTTTLSILLGIIDADSGSYEWFGSKNTYEARHRIGALLEKPNYYPYLTARENLKITALIKGRGEEKIDEMLRYVGLEARKNSKVKTFSTGMKQRMAIAASLLSDPDILILDEPTNGLDPSGIAEVRELIVDIAKTGKTIIMASHLLDEVEKVCTEVAVLKAGTLLEKRSLKGEGEEARKVIAVGAADREKLASTLEKLDEVTIVNSDGDLILIESGKAPEELNRLLADSGVYLNHLSIKRKTLEEQFLEMTK